MQEEMNNIENINEAYMKGFIAGRIRSLEYVIEEHPTFSVPCDCGSCDNVIYIGDILYKEIEELQRASRFFLGTA